LYNPPMERISWNTIALGSLLLISVGLQGGQEVQSPQPEKSKLPVKTEQRGRILGIGGVFFKSANRDQMREWYSQHLGLADKGQGVMLPWRERDDPQKEHVTVWTIFPASTKYFDPSPAPFMVNYIVDDLDALLDRLKQEGVKIDPKRMNASYGHFAWIYDSDGNKIELWQPQSAKP
jgi:catechol 2,3-dioxygenase-like lactoylglutathione lyase family enzyme